MRIRSIRPELIKEIDFQELSAEAALVCVCLLTYADDEGFFLYEPRLIRGELFAIREFSREFDLVFKELVEFGIVEVRGADRRRYGRFLKFWDGFQKPNRPQASSLRQLWKKCETSQTVLHEHSLNDHCNIKHDCGTSQTVMHNSRGVESRGEEGSIPPICPPLEGGVKNGKSSGKRMVKPELVEVKTYAAELGLQEVEAEKFFDHFSSNGWRVGGKAPMKDWKASLRNWNRNCVGNGGLDGRRTQGSGSGGLDDPRGGNGIEELED